jgi:hypothetical protein
MAMPEHPPGEPMTLGKMRHLGVQNLVACVHRYGLFLRHKYTVPLFLRGSICVEWL